eukprot:GFYU01030700.1.p1 GENE.GFYU01030700.1~~GFYU01030700.1.p1  ORF type:complete len:177 (-),score=26.30 GFYU01030700.1:117-626(-)
MGSAVAAVTILTAKSSMEIFITTLKGNNQFNQPFPYLLIPVFITSAVSQIHWINISLRNVEALFHIPTFYCIWNILSITGGQVYFNELDHLTDQGKFLYPLGVFLLTVGIYLLSKRPANAAIQEVSDEETELTSIVMRNHGRKSHLLETEDIDDQAISTASDTEDESEA